MASHLEGIKRKILGHLPLPIEIDAPLPQVPLLSLASRREQLLFFGNYSTLLASRPFEDLLSLYESYIAESSVSYFLSKHRIDVTPKQFAQGLPFVLIRSESKCYWCGGCEFFARAANRMVSLNPSLVEYACTNPSCSIIFMGLERHRYLISGKRSQPEVELSRTIDKSAGKNEIQRYLLDVIDAYVPDIKSRAVKRFVKGEINLAQVENLTGITLSTKE